MLRKIYVYIYIVLLLHTYIDMYIYNMYRNILIGIKEIINKVSFSFRREASSIQGFGYGF